MLSRSICLSLAASPLAVLAVAAVSACSAQVDTSYPGVPLATLSGVAMNVGTPLPTGPIDAALVWASVQFGPNDSLIQSVSWVGESAPVVGQFPASFTLNVYQPPPESSLIACEGSSAHVAFAEVIAVPASADIREGTVGDDVVGRVKDTLVVYLDSDQDEGWSCLPNLGFTFAPTKGFHLVQEVHGTLQPRAAGACYDEMVEPPGGLDTPITMDVGGGPYSLSSTGPSCAKYDCESACYAKAEGCGAPSDVAGPDCEEACDDASALPTASQTLCVEAASCESLEYDYLGVLASCGISGLSPQGTSYSLPSSTGPDAGLTGVPTEDAAVANGEPDSGLGIVPPTMGKP